MVHKDEIHEFFQCLGEIWRDVTRLEFLMRVAIARHDGEIDKFPMPPYKKEKFYSSYPKSFSHYSFAIIREKFNKRFPKVQIPLELVIFRDAMAHGAIFDINHEGIERLVKFKEINSETKEGKTEKQLKIEFELPLEIKTLKKLKSSIHDLCIHVQNLAKD